MEGNNKGKLRGISSWIEQTKYEVSHEDEILACTKIVLRLLRYMKDNNMTQRKLARKLGVTPQYVNKLFHGRDFDLKISTAIRYGHILGINLVEIPEPEEEDAYETKYHNEYFSSSTHYGFYCMNAAMA
jgi:DNA-binding XRE family transcriptional regulator